MYRVGISLYLSLSMFICPNKGMEDITPIQYWVTDSIVDQRINLKKGTGLFSGFCVSLYILSIVSPFPQRHAKMSVVDIR